MIRFKLLHITSFTWLLFFLALTIIVSVIVSAPGLLVLMILTWEIMVVICIDNLKNSIASICFLLTMFIFLFGREICFYYFKLERYYSYLEKENDTAYTCIIFSLIGLFLGKLGTGKEGKKTLHLFVEDHKLLRYIVKRVFFFCYLFQLIVIVFQIIFVHRVGYVASYSGGVGSVGVPAYASYIGAFMPISFYIFLSTKPTRKEVVVPLLLYELYAVLTILTGKRYPFVGMNLVVIIYFVLRNRDEKGWITKNMVIAGLALIPILLVFLTAYDAIRNGNSFKFNGLINSIIHFLDSQGGSINNIKRIMYFKNELNDLKLSSIDSTRSLLFENLISRKLFNITVYSGNSVEHALYGHSLSHRLSYLTYGREYILGRGTGSCYIAELMHDFGYIGVLIGNVIYGKFLNAVDRTSFSDPIKQGIMLAVLYYILLAPRSGFDGFMSNVFGLYSLVGYAMIIVIASLFQKKEKYISLEDK